MIALVCCDLVLYRRYDGLCLLFCLTDFWIYIDSRICRGDGMKDEREEERREKRIRVKENGHEVI